MDKLLKDFEPLFKKYIDDADMSPIMVYMIDNVHPDALQFLAKQFNVDEYKGWYLADTETKKRELIKNAIFLKSKVGTPWAIENALNALGFSNVEIQERIGILYDGAFTHNGEQIYSSTIWVNFGVTIKVENADLIVAATRELIRLLIYEYKRKVCVLVYLRFENL
jgi:P2-related tail formation protein